MSDVAAQMPRYRCHKEVSALKIKSIEPVPDGYQLVFEESGYAPIRVDEKYMRHLPAPGGYYVVYEDGYTSFSPASAFEKGYTRI